MRKLTGYREFPEWDYVRSDYLTLTDQETEADVPVPASLLAEAKLKLILAGLKRSQKVGLLCFLASQGLLTLGGKERLLSLQYGTSIEGLISAEKFASKLSQSEKLQKDFKHAMHGLNRRPRSATFRRTQKRRIGVGYRDKGTLPVASTRERLDAQRDGFVPFEDLPETIQSVFTGGFLPDFLREDGWVDLKMVQMYLQPVWTHPKIWSPSL